MIKFFERLTEGLSIGAQKGFAKSYNKICDIMENLDGAPFSGIKVKRVGDQWRIHYDGSQGGASTAPLLYPFKTTLTKDGSDDVVNVIMGRVYEVNASDQSETVNADFSFTELPNNGFSSILNPGDTWTATPSETEDYVVLVVMRGTGGEINRNYLIGFESALTSGYAIIKRIAKYYQTDGVGKVEQIHMGDVSFAEYRMTPFSLATMGTDTIMYLPADSIVVNGKDFTAGQSGLSVSTLADWYIVTGFVSTGLSLYIKMDDTDGQYGKPVSVEFGTSAPSHPGEIIPIRVLKNTSEGLVSVTHGAVILDMIRPDGNKADSKYRSISKTTTNGMFTDEDQTVSLNGFVDCPLVNADPFVTDDSYYHHFPIREANGDTGCVTLLWWSAACLAEGIGQYLVDKCSWVCDGGTGNDFCLATDFFCWYDSLCDGCGFWEQGENYAINYGYSIGNSGACLAIDLDDRVLQGDWNINGDLCVDIVNANHVCTCSLNIWGATFYISGCSITICTTDGTLRAT